MSTDRIIGIVGLVLAIFGIGLSALTGWDRIQVAWTKYLDRRAQRSIKATEKRIAELKKTLEHRRELSASPSKLIAYLYSEIVANFFIAVFVAAIGGFLRLFFDPGYPNSFLIIVAFAVMVFYNAVNDMRRLCMTIVEFDKYEKKVAASIDRLERKMNPMRPF